MKSSLRSAIVNRLTPREILSPRLDAALQTMDKRLGDLSPYQFSERPPIFVFGAGWRCGSTLLQRLLCSDRKTIIWGEPFEEAIPLQRLSSMICAFADEVACRSGDAYDRLIRGDRRNLTHQWIASLNPGLGKFWRAHRAFFEELLIKPARANGFETWGAKWVRATGAHALYLRWLFPNCRIVFLVRHPQATFESYKGHSWYRISPFDKVGSALAFAAHWKLLADSFITYRERLDAFLVRYEDLIEQPTLLERISAYCGVAIDPSILKVKIGASKHRQVPTLTDKLLISWLTKTTCQHLGY